LISIFHSAPQGACSLASFDFHRARWANKARNAKGTGSWVPNRLSTPRIW